MRLSAAGPAQLSRVMLFALVVGVLQSHVALGQTTTKAAKAPPPVPAAQAKPAVFFMDGCTHDEVYDRSSIVCGDSSMISAVFDGHEVRTAMLTLTLNNGKTVTMRLPRGTDAVFFSDISLEKFLAPYYATHGAPEKARAIQGVATRVRAMAAAAAKTKPK